MEKRLVMLRIDQVLKEFAAIFNSHGRKAFLVGGAVRDMLRGKKAADFDIATDARPEEVQNIFRSVIPTGIKHGTVTVRFKGRSIEVTTFRTETYYGDGRHPDKVEYAASIEEDLSRRDFTMNAIALDLNSKCLVDPFNGQTDIKNHIIRCVGNPAERFSEDGLRPMRALRFAGQLCFDIDGTTLNAIPAALTVTKKVSAERIRDEFDKIISCAEPSRSLLLMEKTGLLQMILPELALCRGVEQKGYHSFDVLTHSFLACDFAAHNGMDHIIRLAALFHDIGKPDSAVMDNSGVWTFYNHEKISEQKTKIIMTRLRYPNEIREKVQHLILEHMFHYEDVWSNAAVRRFIARAGLENLDSLFALRRADSFACAGMEPPLDLLLPLQKRIDKVMSESRALSVKDLAVNGTDLMEIGFSAGKRLGIILQQLLEAVMEDPAMNTREKLLQIAAAMRE